ncbi:MAG: fatty acid--CoA ligase family protein, partial [Sphingobium sp.]
WAAGTLDDLAASAEGSPRARPAMMAAMALAVSPADMAMMIYTSGSTALPKAVVHTQGVITRKIEYMAAINAIIPFEVAPGDRMLVNMPLFWVGGFLTVTAGLTRGASILFDDDHSPHAMLRAIREQGANSVSGSEAVLRSIAALDWFRPDDLARLKPQHTAQLAFYNRFAGPEHHRLTNALGMTETMGPHSGDPDFILPPETGAGTFGFPLEGMEFRIIDPETGKEVPRGEPGNLNLRGRWLMDCFYKRERKDTFDTDGFYATGDKCRHMPDGRLLFEGRLGGMIKTSGANVSPEEVELALLEHPEIVDAAVFGMPDPQREEIVVAVISLRPESSLDEGGVQRWVKERLSAFKVPRRVLFRNSADLPRTPSYKIRKPALIEMIRDQIGSH